ncbi:cytochrome c oxidase assembly protein [Streptomyces sp. NPDC052687]|uniref:cytochrome c oxidase assembly protein n=1 Tax=Streptomyces sp. NPDC052687 TaxID=3154759 RepID=UPI00342D5423
MASPHLAPGHLAPGHPAHDHPAPGHLAHDHPAPGHGAGGGLAEAAEVVLPALALLACAAVYLWLVHRARRRNPVRGWSRRRTASFLTGLALLAVALMPPTATAAHDDFRAHMVQHLLIGMYAPLALVLAAPVTLLLRTLPAARARRVTAVLHSPPARLLAHPAVALTLSVGTLAALYFTPLYTIATASPLGHGLLHTHFLLAGCLFAYVIAGVDPAPSRPGVRTRLVYVGIAIAAHAVVAQLIYGGFWTDVDAPAHEIRTGGEIMYYGGDIAELLLAGALFATWRPRPRPAPPERAPAPRTGYA